MTIYTNAANKFSLYDQIGKDSRGISFYGTNSVGGGGLSGLLNSDSTTSPSLQLSFSQEMSSITSTTLTTGTIIKWTFRMALTNFSLLGATQIYGFSTGLNIFSATDTTARVSFGTKSTGTVFLIAADGTSVTSQTTGISITSGSFHDYELTWIVGTSLSLSIDNSSPTIISTTLPTTIARSTLGFGTTGASTKTVEVSNYSMNVATA